MKTQIEVWKSFSPVQGLVPNRTGERRRNRTMPNQSCAKSAVRMPLLNLEKIEAVPRVSGIGNVPATIWVGGGAMLPAATGQNLIGIVDVQLPRPKLQI